jgi:hypothetical protein
MIAATDTGLVPMRVNKAVRLKDGEDFSELMVLDELDGDRHLVIQVGQAEGFSLAASLQGLRWGRPMTYEFVAPEVLADCIGRQEGDSAEAALLRRALTSDPMTVRRADRPEDLRE